MNRVHRRRAARFGSIAAAAVVMFAHLALGAPSDVGPFRAAVRTVRVERAAERGGSFDALLAYPAGTVVGGADPADGPPIDPAAGACPAVVFGHGFVQTPGRYRSTLESLAAHGYLAIAPSSETGLAPSHRGLALDMRDCLTWLERANADATSFLFGAVNTGAFGFSGHSMGGGCALVAASGEPRVRAVAPLAPAWTRDAGDDLWSRIHVPICIIVGSDDRITPTFRHGGPMYKAAPIPKQLVTIDGGFHCGFTDVSSVGCDEGGISRAAQQALVHTVLVRFFDLHLKGDDSRRDEVWGGARPIDGVTRSIEAGDQAPLGGGEEARVRWIGEQHKAVHDGDFGEKVRLAELARRGHLFAIGPLTGLKGEITVIDGRAVIATVEGGSIRTHESLDHGAAFLVYTNAADWKTVRLPEGVRTLGDMEGFIAEGAASAGVDAGSPLAVRIEGVVKRLRYHVIDRAEGSPLTAEAHERSKVHADMADERVQMIGFYSTEHRGVFTPGDSDIHVHFVSEDGSASGHVEGFELAPGARVLVTGRGR